MWAATRHRPRLWFFAAAVAFVVVLALLFGAAKVSFQTVRRGGVTCGSLVKPIDAEVFGVAGTNPRPCAGSHDGDLCIALAGLVTSGLVIVAVVRSRPGRRDERTTEALTDA